MALAPQNLFGDGDLPVVTLPDENAAAKSLIDKLLKVRRNLTNEEQKFGLLKLNSLIEEYRSLIRATPSQREEMVLYSIERQGAVTENEITGDTRLHPCVVKEVVAALMMRGILYRVPRTVIGSDRPQFALKSTRLKTPEAE